MLWTLHLAHQGVMQMCSSQAKSSSGLAWLQQAFHMGALLPLPSHGTLTGERTPNSTGLPKTTYPFQCLAANHFHYHSWNYLFAMDTCFSPCCVCLSKTHLEFSSLSTLAILLINPTKSGKKASCHRRKHYITITCVLQNIWAHP